MIADEEYVQWIAGIKKGHQDDLPNKLYIYEVDEC